MVILAPVDESAYVPDSNVLSPAFEPAAVHAATRECETTSRVGAVRSPVKDCCRLSLDSAALAYDSWNTLFVAADLETATT